MTDYDVGIVGYGPVGKVMAILLARQGYSVLAVDRFREVYPLPRAVHFDREIGRLFDQIGVGDQVREIHHPRNASSEFRSAENLLLLRMEVPTDPQARWSLRNFFHQPELEAVLARYASQFDNLTFRGGVEAVDIQQDEDSVGLSLRVPDGASTEHKAVRYLVGSDGANSLVRKCLGKDADFTNLHFEHAWLAVDFALHTPGPWPAAGVQHCDPKRPHTWIPVAPSSTRIEFMLLEGETAAQMVAPDAIWRLAQLRGLSPENADIVRSSVYAYKAKWLEVMQSGRVFLAGDAAHLTPPFLGQGLCSGMRDAATLSWRLDRVLRGQAGSALLDSYSSERSSHFAQLVRAAVDLGQLICVTDGEQARSRDELIRAEGARSMLAVQKPRLGDGFFDRSEPAAGTLFPFSPSGSGDQPLEIRFGPKFVLVATHDLELDSHLPDLHVMEIEVLPLPPAPAAGSDNLQALEWLRDNGCKAVLVRPDLYIFGTAAHAEGITRLVQVLKSLSKGDDSEA